MEPRFVRVLPTTQLRKKEQQIAEVIARNKGVPGISLLGNELRDEHVPDLYRPSLFALGPLAELLGRLQVHSPNDYKLQVFLAFINELLPGASLTLYFAKVDGDLTKAETKALKRSESFALQAAATDGARAKEIGRGF